LFSRSLDRTTGNIIIEVRVRIIMLWLFSRSLDRTTENIIIKVREDSVGLHVRHYVYVNIKA